ncbi:hypothetical protein FHS83_000500 [Rhizomicrobium palustre]|uniref:Uncharacterized protein n=1 Tax=Rhizomicrobium palustre TaxID=189966 RepID=A0A846MVT0_9PROT|nr:hypothetical protein [Rhizomicrobium palustre]NIK87182.1 hypothetical protein [Rhizomicrobium palustre]
MADKEAEYLPQGEDNNSRELNSHSARQAQTLGRMRYVLGIGLVLVILMFAIIYMAGP